MSCSKYLLEENTAYQMDCHVSAGEEAIGGGLVQIPMSKNQMK